MQKIKLPIIIDNFFENPDEIRETALSLLKEHSCILNDHGKNYPGIRVATPDYMKQEIISRIEQITNHKLINFVSCLHITSRIHHCGLIHQDQEKLAGLIYLNENPPDKSGTILCDMITEEGNYDVRNFPSASSTRDIDFIRSFGEFKEKFNQENFKIRQTIDNKYNRFILYDGLSYHAPHYYFGNNLFNSRLVLVFWSDYHDND